MSKNVEISEQGLASTRVTITKTALQKVLEGAVDYNDLINELEAKSPRIVCFYHKADLDGICAAAIVKLKHPSCDLIGLDYGDTFPWNEIKPNIIVYMVDFSLPMLDMWRLSSITEFFWIDHHASAINEAIYRGFEASGGQSLDTEVAACQLTWEYVYPKTVVPRAVELIAEYDMWRLTPEVEDFQYGMKALLDARDPNKSRFWADIVNPDYYLAGISEVGARIKFYVKGVNENICEYGAHTGTWNGLRFIAVNAPCVNSSVFDSVYEKAKHDLRIVYHWSGPLGKWKVTLYSEAESNINCSFLAKEYKGGGHVNAAGFYCTELPFSITNC